MEKVIQFNGDKNMQKIFGEYDKNIKEIEKAFDVQAVVRDADLKLIGNEVNIENAQRVLGFLYHKVSEGKEMNEQDVRYLIDIQDHAENEKIKDYDQDIYITPKGKPIKAKTIGQKNYVQAIENHTVTFGIGPAGTGKTYLAVALAVRALKERKVSRIILTRPAVEAGEKLGFLPGDLQEKIDPYLRPLYDSLYEMLGAEVCMGYIEKGIIEIAPLAYMRGRTLNDSFIILDEAQNTTPEQMKMFLTRLGFQSKAVITGDITQIDLGNDKKSGLKEAEKILAEVEDLTFIQLDYKDVVRSNIVQRIIKAYENVKG